jgi:polar amino acid transport system substrate-binding protein
VNGTRRHRPGVTLLCATVTFAAALACTASRERLADPVTPSTTAAPPAAPGCDAPVEENVRSYSPVADKAGAAAQTIKKNALVVGVSADTKLMGFRDPATDMLGGFEVDLLREVARELFDDPNKVEFQVLSFADRIPALQNNRVDVVAETMTVNCTRWQTVNFSTEYLRAGQRVLVRSDDYEKGVRGLGDLGGQKVCATRGGTSLDNLRRNFPDVVPEPVGVVTDCMVLFQQGKVRAIVSDDVILAGFQAQDPFARVILDGDRMTQEPYGMGIKAENTTLTGYINGVLDRMRADGRWQKIYNQWLAGSLGPQSPPPPAYGRPPR